MDFKPRDHRRGGDRGCAHATLRARGAGAAQRGCDGGVALTQFYAQAVCVSIIYFEGTKSASSTSKGLDPVP